MTLVGKLVLFVASYSCTPLRSPEIAFAGIYMYPAAE